MPTSPHLRTSQTLPCPSSPLCSLSPSSYSVRHLHDVCGGDHICYLCQDEDERWRVLSQFYKVGLERKEKMMFFQHQTPEEEVLRRLDEGGVVGIRDCIATGQFSVRHYNTIYMVNGIFEPADMITRVQDETAKCLAEGYSGLRACGDMSWVIKEQHLTEKLLKYESQLHHRFPENYAGLCMYDTSVFKPGDLLQVLATHPQAIINEKLLQNFYFMPPDEYLGPDVNRSMLNRWMRNIEERKAIEEQLIEARMEAERAVHAKASFLATMSHEIRNPTNGIIGSVDMLYQTKLSQDQMEFMNIIQASANHLYRVVNDVLDFSKIESGKLELCNGPLKVQELIEDSLRLCQYSIQRNSSVSLRNHVDHSCPESIIGDQTRLRQILVNLIGNACKFTEEGEVVVSVLVIPKMENNLEGKDIENKTILEFSVSDSGVGIPQKDQWRLFQTFSQIGSAQKFIGTGLGLSICKQLVESMGGQIMVKSVEDKGSTFYFQIPVDLPVPQPVDSFDRPIALSPDPPMQVPLPLDSPLLNPVQPSVESVSPVLPKNVHSAPEDQSPTHLSPPTSRSTSPSSLDSDAQPCSSIPSPSHPHALSGSLSHPQSTALPSPRSSDSQPTSPSNFDFSRANVLVVDDDTTNQKVLSRMFAKMSCKITIAANGFEAIQLANDNEFNLILTDQCMPECDGFMAATKIREDCTKNQRTCPPIVACTGTYEECLMQVMDAIVIKPVRFQTISDLLYRFVMPQFPS